MAGSHGPYDDNRCFFRCLAVHRGAPIVNIETAAKTYFQQYLQHQDILATNFQGISLDDLKTLETLFQLNIFVYDLQETEEGDIVAKLVLRTPYSTDRV